MDSKKRQTIFEVASRTRSLLEILKVRRNMIDDLDLEKVDIYICDLLHFRQYVHMYNFAYESCDIERYDLEQSFSEICEEAEKLRDLLAHRVYRDTLYQLLWRKSEKERKPVEEIHEMYMDRVGLMWIDAGLVRNESNNDESDSPSPRILKTVSTDEYDDIAIYD